MVGKILVTKCLLSSQLSYISSILNLPEHVIKDINTCLFQFIWGGNDRVKRKTIISDYVEGGLKMIYLPHFLDCLKFSWIKRLQNDSIANWKNIALYELRKTMLGVNIFTCNCNYVSLNNIYKKELTDMSIFYRKIVELWLRCKSSQPIENVERPECEVLWNNETVKYNGKTLYFKDWIKNGFITVSSLYNEDGSLKTFNEFNTKISRPGGVMLEYLILFSAIPERWKNIQNINVHAETIIGLHYKSQFNSLDQCTSKLVRNILASNMYVEPVCQEYWKRKYQNHEFHWSVIWENIPKIVKEARLITLNWKILNNIYPTNILLNRMGKKESSKCNVCEIEDTLEHFFFSCKKISKVWNEIKSIIYQRIGKNINLCGTDILFGYYKGSSKENILINQMIVIGKLCISKYKYGKYPNLLYLLNYEIKLRKW